MMQTKLIVNVSFDDHFQLCGIFLITFRYFSVNGGESSWIEDGMCDDINNNGTCGFDGNDCCGANVNKEYCYNCDCISN